ncbi:lysine N(6)-hydroxylase/L-ornithine N(5)-oxygenase family protein [Luedemannella helvata]|uniref:L-lysine N6-monooxygenase MbtG n=1 Tax=Luedemannella helvata TaxID=349315 RepID=A0ABP4X1D9_9ACTN
MNGQYGDPETIDLIGVGFGPANLALAIALEEQGRLRDLGSAGGRVRFVEQQAQFGWHRGMLLDGARMQIAFLKDLVTMRNPRSRYSFLTYLQERGRLVDFINCKNFFPSRVEFHDYLEWAAARFTDVVEYGSEVVRIEPVTAGDGIDQLDVVVRRVDGSGLRRHRARNVVFAAGLQPWVPAGVALSDRVWHSSELLHRLGDIKPDEIRTVLVVGAGQSAAEVTGHLHRVCPNAQVHSVFSRFGYSVADDSPFANRIFDPDAVDVHFQAEPQVRDMLRRYHDGTNYSVVDLDLITELFERSYQEKVAHDQRLHFHNVSRVTSCEQTPMGVDVTVHNLALGCASTFTCDIVVFATGYRPVDPRDLLEPVLEHCRLDEEGGVDIGRNYRVRTKPQLRCGIYVQGAAERSHGLSSVLLSNVAVRAGEIAQALTESLRHPDESLATAPR